MLSDSPEDVARWIAERRARFPTRENVKRKQEELARRAASGEVVAPSSKRLRKDAMPEAAGSHGLLPVSERISSSVIAGGTVGAALSSSSATLSLAVADGRPAASDITLGSQSDVVGDHELLKAGTSNTLEPADRMVPSDDEGAPEEAPVRVERSPPVAAFSQAQTKRPCKWFQRGTCRSGARCAFSHELTTGDGVGKRKAPDGCRLGPGGLRLPKPESQLLRKLLRGEIRAEQNVVLKCFRFFVRNSFFDGVDETGVVFDTLFDGESKNDGESAARTHGLVEQGIPGRKGEDAEEEVESHGKDKEGLVGGSVARAQVEEPFPSSASAATLDTIARDNALEAAARNASAHESARPLAGE